MKDPRHIAGFPVLKEFKAVHEEEEAA